MYPNNDMRSPSKLDEMIKLIDEDGIFIIIDIQYKKVNGVISSTSWVMEDIYSHRKVVYSSTLYPFVPDSTILTKTEIRKLKLDKFKNGI